LTAPKITPDAVRPHGVLVDAGMAGIPVAQRLQILTTEHWSLLSTRSGSWNEAFSRATMFLTALSGAVVALALVAGATSFDGGFTTFALLLLPVVLFAGIATFIRLVEINHEDTLWVTGMNRLRHAYLEAAPDLAPYFVTGWHDDEAGIMASYGAVAGPGSFAHQFVTTPGLLAVVDGVIAGVIAALVGLGLEVPGSVTLSGAVVVGAMTVGILARYQYHHVILRRGRQPNFVTEALDGGPSDGEIGAPEVGHQAGSATTNR
jgi:hypothetical protein